MNLIFVQKNHTQLVIFEKEKPPYHVYVYICDLDECKAEWGEPLAFPYSLRSICRRRERMKKKTEAKYCALVCYFVEREHSIMNN